MTETFITPVEERKKYMKPWDTQTWEQSGTHTNSNRKKKDKYVNSDLRGEHGYSSAVTDSPASMNDYKNADMGSKLPRVLDVQLKDGSTKHLSLCIPRKVSSWGVGDLTRAWADFRGRNEGRGETRERVKDSSHTLDKHQAHSGVTRLPYKLYLFAQTESNLITPVIITPDENKSLISALFNRGEEGRGVPAPSVTLICTDGGNKRRDEPQQKKNKS